MNDSRRPGAGLRAARRRLAQWLRHPLTTPLTERRELFTDLLRQAAQIQTLDDLLVRFPERLRESFGLSGFHLFLLGTDHEGHAEYRLAGRGENVSFAGSSAVVARMKRERRPTRFATGAGTPEAWQLLATSEELQVLTSLGTELLFPLEGRTRLAGFVSLTRAGALPFSADELRFFRDLGPQMGRGLETALLLESLSQEAVERDRARRELLLAREVQEHLLPVALPAVAGVELASFYRSAAEVGGDYFDAFVTPSGALCVVIADVSGKGVPAALVMAGLRASLHALAAEPALRLDGLMSRLNELLFHSSSASRYATLFAALYDPGTETLQFCNAGHNPAALLRASGAVERLSEGGSVLGLLPGGAFQTTSTPFSPGDTLVLYTDGITEARGPDDEEWSEEALHEALREASVGSAEAMLQRILHAVDAFAQGTPPSDDQTLLVLTRQSH